MPIATNMSGFSAFPGDYDSAHIVTTAGGPVGNGQNMRGTNGGAILGVSRASLQNTRIFGTDMGYPYLGQHNAYNDCKPVIGSTIHGITKAVSAGSFSTMVRGKYILMGFTSQVAGITTGAGVLLNSPGAHYNVVGQNLSNAFRNTWLKGITGGWLYQTGAPVNAQYSRDNFRTDKNGTGALPGRLVFQIGNPTVITKQNYAARTGS